MLGAADDRYAGAVLAAALDGVKRGFFALGHALRWSWPFFGGAVTGVAAVYAAERYVPHGPWCEVVKHIGTGFIVAALATLFFHIREVKEHLHKFARIVLVESEYLSTLRPARLFELRRKIGAVILEDVVTNHEYDFGALDRALEQTFFKGMMQGGTATPDAEYRRAYRETIGLRFMTAQQMAQHTGAMPQAGDNHLYVEVTTVTNYEVVSPKAGARPYVVTFSNELSKTPGLLEGKKCQWFVGPSENKMEKVTLKHEEGSNGQLTFKGRYEKLAFGAGGVVTVCRKSIEIERADEAPFSLVRMAQLTHAPTLTVSANISVKCLEIYTMGLGGEQDRGGEVGQTFTLRYDGWMAEDHGYMVTWLPSAVAKEVRP